MSESTPNTEGYNQEHSAVQWYRVPSEVRTKAIAMDWDTMLSETSSDNLVGTVEKSVVKQSKAYFGTEEEANNNAEYTRRAIALYQKLVPDIVVPTEVDIAQYKDQWRIFQFQPHVPGVTTRQLEQDQLQITDATRNNYHRLYRQLFTIYRAEDDTNRYIEEDNRFLLTKVQPIGNHAKEKRFYPGRILASDNLMVHPDTGQFFMFDFGAYRAWRPEMEESYTKILEKAQAKLEKHMP